MKNQQMLVNLGQFGTLEIGHKTELGSADQILAIGNEIRESKGLHPKTLHTYLQLSDTWEKMIKVYNEEGVSDCDITEKQSFCGIPQKLSFNTINDLPKYDNGMIAYPEILKTVYNPRHSSNSYYNCLLDIAETMRNLPRVGSKREEYLNNLILLINMKYVDSWTQLKIAIEKL